MVGAGRFADVEGEAAAGERLLAGRQLAHDRQPLRVAERVQHRGQLDLVGLRVEQLGRVGDLTHSWDYRPKFDGRRTFWYDVHRTRRCHEISPPFVRYPDAPNQRPRILRPPPRPRLPGPVHGGPRRLDRQRRAALDPGRPRLLRHRPAVGRQRLHADLRRLPHARRPRLRPLRPPRGLPRRHRAVRRSPRCSAPLADSQALLLGARALQGIGGATISPAGLAIIASSFAEGSERNRALGVWGAMAGLGGSSGAILGGLLTQGLGWPAIFLVNVPIGIAVVLAGRRIDPPRRDQVQRSFDLVGAVLVTAGLTALVYAIVRTDTLGWTSPGVLAPAAGAVALLGLFALYEGRDRRRPADPPRRLPPPALAQRQPGHGAALRRRLRDVVLRLALPAGGARPRRARNRARLPAAHARLLRRLDPGAAAGPPLRRHQRARQRPRPRRRRPRACWPRSPPTAPSSTWSCPAARWPRPASAWRWCR